jgi:hypothetical protein
MLVISSPVGGPEVQPPQAKSEPKGRVPGVLVFSWCPGIFYIMGGVPVIFNLCSSLSFLSLFPFFTHQKTDLIIMS